jgi:hypothetical protein
MLLCCVDRIRVFCPEDDTRSVFYWYNESKHVYQYVRSETPMCVETDTDPRLFDIENVEAFVSYLENKCFALIVL